MLMLLAAGVGRVERLGCRCSCCWLRAWSGLKGRAADAHDAGCWCGRA